MNEMMTQIQTIMKQMPCKRSHLQVSKRKAVAAIIVPRQRPRAVSPNPYQNYSKPLAGEALRNRNVNATHTDPKQLTHNLLLIKVSIRTFGLPLPSGLAAFAGI
jgi:hypothetical protein